MTCIVAAIDDGQVVMGADSCGSDYWRSFSWEKNRKVVRLDLPDGEPILFGCTGSYRLIDLLRYRLELRKIDDDPDRWLRAELIPAFVRAARDNGYEKKDDGRLDEMGTFLVGARGRLWRVQDDLSVLESESIGDAVGSGDMAARGVLYALSRIEAFEHATELRVWHALEAAAATIATVRGPFHVETIGGEG